MKTLHFLIVIIAIMASLVAFGTYVIAHPIFGGTVPSMTIKGYVQIDTPGLEKIYQTGQPINFSVLVQGFGLYPCQPPQIVIYNNTQTKPMFYYTAKDISCPDSSEHYIYYFPSQNKTFYTIINETGTYTVKISVGQDSYQKQFSVIPSNSSRNLDVKSKITDNDTYLSQTVDEWKNKTPEQLGAYYKKYKDAFYDELGSFLIKDEMKKELERQKIKNIHDDFKVFPGMSLDSLPPHVSYDAVVNATNGNSYLLLGGVFANKIDSSLKIIKLVFDKDALHSLSTGKNPSYANPFASAHVDNSTFREKLRIAGTYVEDSDIPWSSVGTGNYGVIEIGLYTSVYHMIPDAQKYYTVRAMQLIPFYIQVKILPPPSTEKQS